MIDALTHSATTTRFKMIINWLKWSRQNAQKNKVFSVGEWMVLMPFQGLLTTIKKCGVPYPKLCKFRQCCLIKHFKEFWFHKFLLWQCKLDLTNIKKWTINLRYTPQGCQHLKKNIKKSELLKPEGFSLLEWPKIHFDWYFLWISN